MLARIAFLSLGLFSVSLLASAAQSQEEAIPLSKAREAFDQARILSDADAGRLWGHRLYGPMLFADPRTRTVVGNQPDKENRLTEKEGLFVGKLSDQDSVANTAYKWGGVSWTMLMWPLPTDRYSRGRLLMHESFHRIQQDLGLPASNPLNNHLSSREARAWLRLEWRALAEALIRRGEQRETAIKDALLFRTFRRLLFSQAGEQERALELNEGLAEYTGYKLCGWPEQILADRAAIRLEQDERGTNFIRSFAYTSGPAWGILLDQLAGEWRQKLNRDSDLASILAGALAIAPSPNLEPEANRRSVAYEGALVRADEARRAEVQAETLARNRARFLDGPALILPFSDSLQYTFDPRSAEGLGDTGTVYESARITDQWGVLEITKGVLMSREPSGKMLEARVPAPAATADTKLNGDGWVLTLAEGWRLVAGARKGDLTVRKDK